MQKANMMYLSKDAKNKDESLKMKLLLSTDDKAAVGTELIWKRNGFFGDQKGEFTINKPAFPENTLIYTNQGWISTLKGGDHVIYLDYVVLGQLICAKNLPEDFDNYECKPDEVKLYVPIYKNETGEYKGLQNWLAYIMVNGVMRMRCFSHMDMMKISLAYCTQPLNKFYQTYSRALHLRNTIQCYWINEQFKNTLNYFSSCLQPLTEKRK